MTDNYANIVQDNLNQLYGNLPKDLAQDLPGEQEGERFIFNAFGEKCQIDPEGISLGDKEHSSVFGILISLYALNARPDPCVLEPLKGFKEFPDSMPYVGAFSSHSEQILVSAVGGMQLNQNKIMDAMNGEPGPSDVGGDIVFRVRPLPKIALCYILYESDEDFPPSVTCLYSNNANRFMPMDGLADVGEYTSRAILDIIR